MSTYYQLLGLAPNASETEIRSAYARDMLGLQGLVHPNAAQFRTALDEAFATLIDPEKRAAYDAQLRKPRPKAPKAPEAPKVPKAPKAPKTTTIATKPTEVVATAETAVIVPADPRQQASIYARNGGLAFALGGAISAVTYVFSNGTYLLAWVPLVAGIVGLSWWLSRYIRIPNGAWRPDHALLVGGLVLFGLVSAGWVGLSGPTP